MKNQETTKDFLPQAVPSALQIAPLTPASTEVTHTAQQLGKEMGNAALPNLECANDDLDLTQAVSTQKEPVPTTPGVQKTPLSMTPVDVWERCTPASNAHPYVNAKCMGGPAMARLRVTPEGEHIQGIVNALVVPAYCQDGKLQSLQLISPNGSVKKNLKDVPITGASFTVGTLLPGELVYLCEDVGAAAACWIETGRPAIACFSAGNMSRVATELRKRHPSAPLVLVPSVGYQTEAESIAKSVGASVAYMPKNEQKHFDASDLLKRDDVGSLELVLEAAVAFEADVKDAKKEGLSVVFADELPDEFTPADELVEGLLTTGAGSVLYGDSNSGKTFFAIDLACAVALGKQWMGRNTEQGMVVYVAAESPSSVRSRVQAYQRYHGVKVPNFAIVQSPIDLFNDEHDTELLIAEVKKIERERGQTARLIVGDTLARMSAGANESAGKDMGLVVRRFDMIRAACNAHFLLVHHSGKNAASGARGWSGVRAAIDTEIEVTDIPAGRCAEITKQRDLGTKGARIGFCLDVITLGKTKWGDDATSCIVKSIDAPQRQPGKRASQVVIDILDFLKKQSTPIDKQDIVKHFELLGRTKSNIYRTLRTLVDKKQLIECDRTKKISLIDLLK